MIEYQMKGGERGEKTPDILQLLEDIRIHFEQLKQLYNVS